MENKKGFPCTECGLCCKNIAHIIELKDFDLGNGTCKYFDKNTNICSIYENRPDICRVDLMFEKEYFKYFTKDEFYKLNAQACNKFQKKFNLDEKYMIILKQ